MTTQEMFQHNENARALVLAIAEELDRESFLSRQAGTSSIRDLLVHLMDAEDYWIGSVVHGERRQMFLPEKYENATALQESWEKIRSRTRKLVSDIANGLTSERRTVPWEGDRVLDVDTILLHVLSHELHHIGQICLLIRQHGYEPPYVDLL